jgi:hypothetical protein
MSQDFAQRRRVALALAITAVAVPAAFLLNRSTDSPEAAPPMTIVGTVAGVDAGGSDAGADGGDADGADDGVPTATDAMGTTPVGFLDGTVPPQDGDPATIAIPRVPQSINGTATFRRSIPGATVCQVRTTTGIPFNSRITVTNLDNSRSVQCIASVGGAEPDDDVVLHDDAFVQIGDLTDAPIPVQITW